MIRRSLGMFLFIAACGTFAAPLAHAATSGTATVTLAAAAQAAIQILDPAVTLSPTATDYDNDYIEAAGAAGLRVRVRSNSSSGMTLSVRCSDAAPEIPLDDLLVRTQTAAGAGGTTMSSYTAITASDQTLWTSTVAENGWRTVTTDVRVQNLISFDDDAGAGTTDYTNTLTYTVAVQ